MEQKSAHSSIWYTTDFMILTAVAAGLVLENFVLEFGPLPVSSTLRLGLGGLLILVGILLIIFAKYEFHKSKQPSMPGKPTTKIVKSGIFKYSRNPLYLGIVIAFAGVGVMFDMVWFILLDIPLGMVFNKVLIVPEERYLSENFGEEYLLYMRNVRRWL